MFRAHRIITVTELRKRFKRIAKEVIETEEPYLVLQKGGQKLVLVDAQSFDDMIQTITMAGLQRPQGVRSERL